jgi:phosphoglycerate kinase
MPVSVSQTLNLCRLLKGFAPRENLSLQDYLRDVPQLESLADLPAGTPVLVRGDVDAKVGANIGDGDIRLRSMVETLKYGQQRGWKQIIFGHRGRKEPGKPIGSLDKVAARLGQLLGCEVPLIADWLDEATATVRPHVPAAIGALPKGGVCVLENVRTYDLEIVLWKAKEAELPAHAEKLTKLANSLAENVAPIYVHEALSAGSLDASSTIVPLAMNRVAIGKYLAAEFLGPMLECLQAKLVIFSGIKIDKLDDLEAMIARGTITHIFSAGSLAMALKKAAAQLDGGDFNLGESENLANEKQAFYIPPDRIEQAKRMIAEGRRRGIQFTFPVDFVLQDGSVATKLGPGMQQFDVGPATIALFTQQIQEFIASVRGREAQTAVFHNGVFGKFEDAAYEAGTKAFIGLLKTMTDAGLKVYVGGGEGGTALERYGKPDWVSHCFTAGGTVLNALGSEPVPYLVALRQAAKK